MPYLDSFFFLFLSFEILNAIWLKMGRIVKFFELIPFRRDAYHMKMSFFFIILTVNIKWLGKYAQLHLMVTLSFEECDKTDFLQK